MARSVDFVTDFTGQHWLPRPTSWIKGWIVHRWFEHRVGPAKQASPEYFKVLIERFSLRNITEADNGTITITPPPLTPRSLP
jgi:hypothetical protein